MSTNAVIYCRTASGSQVVLDEAAQKQEQSCREISALFDFEISEVFCDLGVSGNSETRTGFDALLNFLHQHKKPITVLISSRDRLARDLRVFFMLEEKLSDFGATLVIANEVHGETA